MAPKYNLVQSLCRAFSLLEYIGNEGAGKGITAIAKHAGLHKSTCFGLLYTLQELGYVTQDETGKYSLGLKVFELGNAFIEKLDLQRVAQPYLTRLSELSRETVHLVLRNGLHAVYIDKIEGPHAMTISSRVGKRAAMYCTGVGKCILAFMSPEEQQEVMKLPMPARTQHTITSPEMLLKRLEEIRAQGFGLDEQEIEIGLCCIAAPVFGPQGRVIGGISIAGPEARLSRERINELTSPIVDAAKSISRQMGHLG